MATLNDIKSRLTKLVGNTQFVIIILVFLIFLAAAFFLYRQYVGRNLSKDYVTNNEFSQDGKMQTADIYFFYTTWCPHCKTAKPIWNDFKAEMEDQTVNGYTLNFFEVDCDKDQATSDKFKVKGFPTIKLVNGNKIIEYDAKPSKVNLMEFVNKTLV